MPMEGDSAAALFRLHHDLFSQSLQLEHEPQFIC